MLTATHTVYFTKVFKCMILYLQETYIQKQNWGINLSSVFGAVHDNYFRGAYDDKRAEQFELILVNFMHNIHNTYIHTYLSCDHQICV